MNIDDFDRNLDTQRRRLDDMDTAVAAALADEPTHSNLPTGPARQSYAELTVFNDQLRVENAWSEIDLDAALTPELAAALAEWRSFQRVPWTTADLTAVGIAGALGGSIVWFDTAIDSAVRQRLNSLTQTPLGQIFEKAGKRLPIDYMGPGFGGRAHRVKSAGHDLLRPVTALRQIMKGEFTGIRWSFGEHIPVLLDDKFDPVPSFEQALLRWLMHLAADVFTTMSLPIPGFSLLYEMDNKAISDFALHAYSGLRAGDGLNLRSAIVAPGITTIATELVIRTHTHLSALREQGSAVLTRQQQRKRSELQLAAHSLVGAASIGKALGKALLAPHPGHIRHVNIPTLVMAGKSALLVSADASAERRASAPTWDELVIGSAQPWQLELAQDIEAEWVKLG